MTVSACGVRGGRSSPQSNPASMTTLRGTNRALSVVLRADGSSGRWPNTAWANRTSPSTALPYGSSSSLAGLHRFPLAGSQGPCTR